MRSLLASGLLLKSRRLRSRKHHSCPRHRWSQRDRPSLSTVRCSLFDAGYPQQRGTSTPQRGGKSLFPN